MGTSGPGSSIPSVKAYRGAMPPGRRGVEFTTPIAPHRGAGTPYEARWYYPPHTPGVLARRNAAGEDFAAIPATVINLQP